MALRTWMVVLCSCLFVGVGMADPSVDSSSAPSSDTECYRAELDSFVKQFESAPQVVQSDVDEARLAIANADAESLELMYRSLSANPNWRAIPGVMVSVAAGQEEWQRAQLTRLLEESFTPVTAETTEDPEVTRASLLQVVSQLRRFAPMVADPNYEANVARLEEKIQQMDPASIPMARDLFAARSTELREKLGARSEGPIKATDACDDACDWDITGACESVCDGITSAFNAIIDGFTSFVTGPITNIINSIV